MWRILAAEGGDRSVARLVAASKSSCKTNRSVSRAASRSSGGKKSSACRIVDDILAPAGFFQIGNLSRHPCAGVLCKRLPTPVRPVVGHHARDKTSNLHFVRHHNQDEFVESLHPPRRRAPLFRFEDERRFHEGDTLRIDGENTPHPLLFRRDHSRVDDVVELARLVMLKGQLRQCLAIERAIAADHALAEYLDDGCVDRLPRLH
jgi:hypothetical protein